MGVVPTKPIEKVQFYENHITAWNSAATGIGLTTTEVTDIGTKTAAARAAYDTQQVALETAKNASQAFYDAVAAMATAGSAAIKKIRAKAEMSGSSVYTLAVIPPPATPSPVGAPGLPFQLVATLKPAGSLELSWKCNNPPRCNGVIYQVYRRVESTGEYTYIGGAGNRKFVDTTVPSAVASVTYQIQGTRSTAVGDVAEFVVNFGTTGSGTTMVSSVASAKPAKIAA